MITDEQIEKILFRYTTRQDEYNLSVIKIIAERLAHLAEFDRLNMLDREVEIRKDLVKISRLREANTKKQKEALKDDFWWIAWVLYAESLKFYEEQIELRRNKELMEVIETLTTEAQKSLEQILTNQVIVMRDMQNIAVLRPFNLVEAYRSIMSEATMYHNVSNSMREVALKRTETQLFDSGVRLMIDNSSDDARDATSANNAIRMNVLDSAKKLINKMQDIMGKQFGANAVELSAHIYPAPDHAPAQGHQFSKEEVEKMQSGDNFEDLQGNSYVGFERNIGQWNCRHYFMRIKKGAEPQYTQEQLDKILKDNERGYTDENGKHRTLYECTQVQRRYEREIRRAKEKYLYGKALDNKEIMSMARNRVGALTTQYKQFSIKCDIPAKLERIKVKDYR